MHYERPQTRDFANVAALNRAYLSLLSSLPGLPGSTTSAADEVAGRLTALAAEQSERLAACPFLLFSLAENDVVRWHRLFDGAGAHDLVDTMQRPPGAFAQLAAAGLGFLWELSRRNPYALRLLCGAGLEWSEMLASMTPIRLMQFAANEPGLLVPRFDARNSIWQKLLAAGTHADEEIRCAAHIAALQVMLTRQPVATYRPMAAAACKTMAPARRVAEQPGDAHDN